MLLKISFFCKKCIKVRSRHLTFCGRKYLKLIKRCHLLQKWKYFSTLLISFRYRNMKEHPLIGRKMQKKLFRKIVTYCILSEDGRVSTYPDSSDVRASDQLSVGRVFKSRSKLKF